MIPSRRRLALAGAGMASCLALAQPAAATDAGMAFMTGSTSQGLPVTGCVHQDVSFTGLLVIAGDHTGIYGFSFNGSSLGCETALAGSGSGEFTGDLAGSATYSRTGSHLSFSGSVTSSGDTSTIVRWDCAGIYAPTTAMQCSVVLA